MRNRNCATIAVALAILSNVQSAGADEAKPRRHFSASNRAVVAGWQSDSRTLLCDLLKLSDLVAEREKSLEAIPFNVNVLSTEEREGYVLQEIELNSTSSRRIKAIVTIPTGVDGEVPAVVCIHGHGGNRRIVYKPDSLYRGFAAELAASGYVTISTEVGQHEVYESGRTLMGERLWDVLRCADYLSTREEVDRDRMGCAGLSLGGEMAMWLGAMDPRMKATVSSGFLSTVENMRQGHCMCWDFPGFTENFDFSDIYGLIAPRALLCQIGAKEGFPGGFPPSTSHAAMVDIQRVYAVFKCGHLAQLDIHSGGHVFDTDGGCDFLDEHLKRAHASGGN